MERVYNRNPVVESAPMRDEMVIFNPGNGKFCHLNATAALLWSKLETPQTAQELVGAIEAYFEGTDSSRASRDVQAALSQLLEVNCILTTQTDQA